MRRSCLRALDGPGSQRCRFRARNDEFGERGPVSFQTAGRQLGVAKNREVLGWMKERLYGENAAINEPHGAAHMLRNPAEFSRVRRTEKA
ncbi:MAG: hypothetical protein Ct9H300mP8_08030 [Gammaproteobacteria bacterium]|nr:MAG: hypothetical protein Ct9H300mP8_08030 [Gammaproteobacteria bacterium]